MGKFHILCWGAKGLALFLWWEALCCVLPGIADAGVGLEKACLGVSQGVPACHVQVVGGLLSCTCCVMPSCCDSCR